MRLEMLVQYGISTVQLWRGPQMATCMYIMHPRFTRILRNFKAYRSHSDVKIIKGVPSYPTAGVDLIGICHSAPREPPYCSTSKETAFLGEDSHLCLNLFQLSLFLWQVAFRARQTKRRVEYSPDR